MSGPATADDPRMADARDLRSCGLWILDLDGVLWLSGQPIGDVARAVTRLRSVGASVLFATNNSDPTVDVFVARLAKVGIEAAPEEVVSSAQAVTQLVPSGSRVKVLAGVGVVEALTAHGVVVADDGPFDGAVVGWSREFNFDALTAIADAARSSGVLVGTNEDPTHPTPSGLAPGSGALLAAVAVASGVTPQVAGKPHEAMVRLIEQRRDERCAGATMVMVGDQPGTDGRLAERLDIPFALVDSGVTPAHQAVTDVPVAIRRATFVELVDEVWAEEVGENADPGRARAR